MKYVVIAFLVFTTNIAAQIKDCSKCSTIKYTAKDIPVYNLTALQLLRNEIFARHQYVFKDERLESYFRKFDWYHPDYNKPNKINLSDIETHNVNLFKSQEDIIKSNQEALLAALEEFKKDLLSGDHQKVKKYLENVEDQVDSLAIKELVDFIEKVDIQDIHWYGNRALYQIDLDNGFVIHRKSIEIDNNNIRIEISVPTHSKQIKKSFEYGSDYYSEYEEYNCIWIFIFENHKLSLKDRMMAG